MEQFENVPEPEPVGNAPMTPQPENRGGGCLPLFAGGLVSLLGLGFLGLCGLTLLSALMGVNGAPFETMIPGIMLYGMLGLFCLVMGAGTFLGRRNARNIMLAASWMGLVMGILSCLIFIAVMPPMMQNMMGVVAEENGPDAAIVILPAIVVMMVFMAVLYVGLPGLLVLLYRSRRMKTACERLDPEPRWTDTVPLPLLALGIMLLGSGSFQVVNAAASPFLPVPGGFITGIPAAAALLAMAVITLLLGWGTLKRHMAAWWGLLAMLLLGSTYGFFTFRSLDLAEMYREMGFPDTMIDTINGMDLNGILAAPRTLIIIGITMALMFLLVLWLRKFFREDTPAISD